MIIRKKSRHYCYYRWLHLNVGVNNRQEVPVPRNLCQYVRSITLRTLAIAPWFLFVGFLHVIMGLLLLIKAVWLLVFQVTIFRTHKPAKFYGLKFFYEEDVPFDVFELEPVGKWRGWGAWIPLTAWLIYFISSKVSDNFVLIKEQVVELASLLLGIGLVVVLIALCFGIAKLWTSDSMRLVREYFKAKKRGICPLIEVVDDRPSN